MKTSNKTAEVFMNRPSKATARKVMRDPATSGMAKAVAGLYLTRPEHKPTKRDTDYVQRIARERLDDLNRMPQ